MILIDGKKIAAELREELKQEISELTLEVIGYYGIAFQDTSLGTNEPPIGDEDYRAVAGKYQNLRATTIYGGSNEIQRNIISYERHCSHHSDS